MSTARDRQAAYRARRRQGDKAITVWLDSDAYAILERQARAATGDRSDRLAVAAVIGDALRALDAVTSDVTGNVTSHKPLVTSDGQAVTSNVTSHKRAASFSASKIRITPLMA